MEKNEAFIRAWVDNDAKTTKVMVNATGFEVSSMIYAIISSLHERGYDAAVRHALFAFFEDLDED